MGNRLRDRVLRNAGARPATPGEERTLYLLDRRDRHATAAPTPVVVTVSAACPVKGCGKARGEPEIARVFDVWSQTEHPLSIWRNPCGHVDLHVDVIEEAVTYMFGRHLGASA